MVSSRSRGDDLFAVVAGSGFVRAWSWFEQLSTAGSERHRVNDQFVDDEAVFDGVKHVVVGDAMAASGRVEPRRCAHLALWGSLTHRLAARHEAAGALATCRYRALKSEDGSAQYGRRSVPRSETCRTRV